MRHEFEMPCIICEEPITVSYEAEKGEYKPSDVQLECEAFACDKEKVNIDLAYEKAVEHLQDSMQDAAESLSDPRD